MNGQSFKEWKYHGKTVSYQGRKSKQSVLKISKFELIIFANVFLEYRRKNAGKVHTIESPEIFEARK